MIIFTNSAARIRVRFGGFIRDGGGEPVLIHPGTDVRGEPNGLYYQVSEWGRSERASAQRARGRFRRQAGATSSFIVR